MESLLNVDLNEIVTKEVSDQIAGLEKQIERDRETIRNQRNEIDGLTKTLQNAKNVSWFLDYLRNEYSKIKASKPDDSGYFDSLQKNQFLFIEKILDTVFNIHKSYGGWYCSRHDGRLATHLAVNYYSNKTEVIKLLKILTDNHQKDVDFINSYIMPYDYPLADIVAYASNPHYCTNGIIFGVAQYWIEYGAGKENMPHDLIMKSHFMAEKNVFDIVISTIKKRKSNWNYLFALPKYNSNLTTEQVQEMGECLITVTVEQLKWDDIKSFISSKILSFNTKTLDFFYGLISNGNQYNTLHWQNFPTEYQMKHLMAMDTETVMKTLNEYSCKWSAADKSKFLKNYLNQEQ